jgi:hypothetical protein
VQARAAQFNERLPTAIGSNGADAVQFISEITPMGGVDVCDPASLGCATRERLDARTS